MLEELEIEEELLELEELELLDSLEDSKEELEEESEEELDDSLEEESLEEVDTLDVDPDAMLIEHPQRAKEATTAIGNKDLFLRICYLNHDVVD